MNSLATGHFTILPYLIILRKTNCNCIYNGKVRFSQLKRDLQLPTRIRENGWCGVIWEPLDIFKQKGYRFSVIWLFVNFVGYITLERPC